MSRSCVHAYLPEHVCLVAGDAYEALSAGHYFVANGGLIGRALFPLDAEAQALDSYFAPHAYRIRQLLRDLFELLLQRRREGREETTGRP